MQLGMIGLGRMGANMVRRLMKGGHECVVFDMSPANVAQLGKDGATGSSSLDEFLSKLKPPRAVWLMVPAAVVDQTLEQLASRMQKGDIIIDGGNSYYIDDIRRAKELQPRGIHYADVGTSGGVWGLERGYCLMIGGEPDIVKHLDPIFKTLAPGRGNIDRTPGREKVGGTAEDGYLHCGPVGGGHFVKMVHNGIEYGIMAAYAEGLNILHHANVGKTKREADAETSSAAQSGALPIRFQSGRRHGSVAARKRGGFLAARSDGDFVARSTDAREILGPRVRFRRRPLDHYRRHRRRNAGAGLERGTLPALHSRGEAISPTSCFPRCASNSAGHQQSG